MNILVLLSALAMAKPPNMAFVKGGAYQPFFERSKDGLKSSITVQPFYLDITPVTNGQYLDFVKKNKKWRKSQAIKIFADTNYLSHWSSDLEFSKVSGNQPVRNVSWFAANRYCESLGKELPTVLQWEFVAAADETKGYAMDDEAYKQKILKWYSRPSTGKVSDVGKEKSNFWGVKDMHGLQWEWTLDFNTALVTGESREDSILDKNLFCGSGSLGAKDKLDYGSFMRFGFRSSLKGNYAVGNLGFRCAKSIEEK